MWKGSKKETSPILTANLQREKCRGGDTLVQRRTCGNVLPGCRDGTGGAGTGTFCPETDQRRSRRYILLGAGAGAVYLSYAVGCGRCGQPGDDVGEKSRSRV